MIVYSSITGNTEIIAKAIKDTLDKDSCIYFGKPDEIADQDAPIIFVGFWVYKGSCSEEIKTYLRTLQYKKIVLFGTAGFDGSEEYYDAILEEVKQNIPESNKVIDSFMCQGKMPHSILARYLELYENNLKTIIF